MKFFYLRLLFVPLLIVGSLRAEELPTVTIGAILPLSGPVSPGGLNLKRGMDLAIQEHAPQNASIRLLYEDDLSTDKKAAVTAARKLANVDRVHLVVNAYTNTAASIAPVLAVEQIPMAILWDSNEDLRSLGANVFSLGFSTERAGELMAEEAHGRFKLSSVAVVSLLDEWAQLTSRAFVKRANTLGIRTSHQEFAVDTTEFRSAVTNLRGFDAVYVALYGTSLHAFVRQLRQSRFGGMVLSGDGIMASDARELGPLVEGVVMTNVFLDDRHFLDRLREKLGLETSPGTDLGYTALAYDGMRAVLQAVSQMKQVSPFNPEEFRSQLRKVAFDGVLGRTELHGQSADRPQMLVVVRKGEIVPFDSVAQKK